MHEKPLPLRRVRLPSASKLAPYLRAIDRANWYTNFGEQSRALEKRLAAHFGCDAAQAVCAANGTLALAAALLALEVPRGSLCAVPSFTFTGTIAAVLLAGLRPWFVDADRESWALGARGLQARLARAPGAVGAAVPVAPFGAAIDQLAWVEFTRRTGIPAVIDGAWCFDSAGEVLLPTMVSLHATKVLGAGEGAVVVGGGEAFSARLRSITNYGIAGDEGSVRAGGNFKMSEYAAAVGQAALDAWPRRRRADLAVKAQYRRALSGMKGLSLMPGFEGDWAPATCPVAFDAPVATEVCALLARKGIESRKWWGRPCHLLPAYRDFPATEQENTFWLCERALCLPMFESMTAADVRRVAGAVRSALDSLRCNNAGERP